jgi:hypothetical protein
MGILLNSLTQEMTRSADIIWAIDRARPGYIQQVYGQEMAARVQMPGQPAHRIHRLEVEIDSANPQQLQSLLRQVECVKGRLPMVVQPLKAQAETTQ